MALISEPSMLAHTTKYSPVSTGLPGPTSSPHQLPTSALPVSAWHTTTQLPRAPSSAPYVRYRGDVAA